MNIKHTLYHKDIIAAGYSDRSQVGVFACRFIVMLLVFLFFMMPVFYATESSALVPSLGSVDSDGYILDGNGTRLITPDGEVGKQLLWTHVMPNKSDMCPGDTVTTMSLDYIIEVFKENGLFPGVFMLSAQLAVFAAEATIAVPFIEGIKIACPPANPEYPGEDTYWNNDDVKNSIVFRHSPCIGFLDIKSDFKAPKDNGKNYGDATLLGVGEKGGYLCAGWRIGDGLEIWKANEKHYLEGTLFLTKIQQDRICLYAYIITAWKELVCQYMKPAPKALPPAMACFMPRVCGDESFGKQRYPFSVSARIVQCVEGSVRAMFERGYRTKDGTYYPDPLSGTQDCQLTNFTAKFQLELRRAITALLTLYVIFYGMKIAFGVQQTITRGEFMMKMLTFALVSYFAVGDAWDTYFPAIISMSNALAGIVLDSSTGGYYCSFPVELYADEASALLRLWDTLDCKFYTYFSVNEYYPKMLIVSYYALHMGGIWIWVFSIILGIFLIAIMIYAVQVYISSMLGIALLVFISPIFVPMVLFEPTKKYFQGWLDSLIAFSMYPVVLFGFLSLMFVTFDVFYWGEPRIGEVGPNERNKWRYVQSSAQPFRCGTTGAGYKSIIDCKNSCTTGECRLDQSLLELPEKGIFVCPINKHTYKGKNSASRCADQCYQEIDVNDDRALRMQISDLGGTLDTSYETARLYRNCMSGNYTPEFKAECTDVEDGELFLTKKICEQPGNCLTECRYVCDESTLGCQLYRAEYTWGFSNSDEYIFGDLPIRHISNFSISVAFLSLLKILGVGILFFYYLSIIGQMIANLVGSHKMDISGLVSNPQAMMKGMKSTITGTVEGAFSGAKNKSAKDGVMGGAKGMMSGMKEMDDA